MDTHMAREREREREMPLVCNTTPVYVCMYAHTYMREKIYGAWCPEKHIKLQGKEEDAA
jgi:hypothetical protein